MEYADRINLLVGLETDYITPPDLVRTKALLEDEEIQYVVGSVHHVRGVSIDFDRSTWFRSIRHVNEGTTGTTMILDQHTQQPIPVIDKRETKGYDPSIEELRPFLMDYFDAQYEMLQALQPEVVGHFDLCLLWTPEVSLRFEREVWEKLERNVEYIIGYGGLFEANAAALRKGWRTSYPGLDILRVGFLSILC